MAFSDSINAFVMDVRVRVTVSLPRLLLQTALKQFDFVLSLFHPAVAPKYWLYWQSEDILERGAHYGWWKFQRTV